MASLTQTAKQTKKVTLIIVGVLVFSIILKIVLSIFGFIGYVIATTAPVAANNGYGTLPNISIDALPYQTSSNVEYILNTPNGGFPSEAPVSDVYKYINTSGVSLLSVDDATQVAAALGFTSSYTKLSQYIYEWELGSRTFVYNIETNQFRIVNTAPYDQIVSDTSTAGGNVSLTQAGVSSAAAGIMHQLGISSDYNLANPTIVYLTYASDNSVTVSSDGTGANAIKVIFYRNYPYLLINSDKEVSNTTLPLLGDNPVAGDVSITLDNDGATASTGVLDLNFSDWPIDSTNYGIYNVKNPQQAWQDVQNGQAYLVYLVEEGNSPFGTYQTQTVTKFEAESISLAYFDGTNEQTYLEPIYVIEGTAILSDGTSATFYFYDPAVIN